MKPVIKRTIKSVADTVGSFLLMIFIGVCLFSIVAISIAKIFGLTGGQGCDITLAIVLGYLLVDHIRDTYKKEKANDTKA